jgi:hypothetical protein
MAKKKTNGIKIGKQRKNGIPLLVVPKNATLRQIYAICKREFSAADLAKYLQDEPMVPMEQVLAEMEKIHREETEKRQKRGRKK